MLLSSPILLACWREQVLAPQPSDNSWILSEDVAGSLSIVVEDEDFGSTENQESLRIDH